MNNFPRMLIVSHNCFSKTNSNGRTLAKLLEGYPKDKIAQFFIQKAMPDFQVCENYFCVTDSDALSAFLKGKMVGQRIINTNTNVKLVRVQKQEKGTTKKALEKTPFTMLMREMIWKSKRWQGNAFNTWVEQFNPEVILLQAGSNAFMFKLATELAKKRKIPLIIYNTEGYFFKEKNYMKGNILLNRFYLLFHGQFKKQFKKSMNYASCAIYNCELLKHDYDKYFECPSYVIYNSSNIVTQKKDKINNPPIITYSGNLGVGRYKSLIEIAVALQSINPEYKLNVYGKAPTEEIKNQIVNCCGISYKGFVTYEEVVEAIHSSDILVHVENFSKFYREELKYAFSTKIADCLKSGVCFFNYAPKEFASTQYLMENNAACIVTEKDKLVETLTELIENKPLREQFVYRAVKLVERNHDSHKNGEYMAEIVRGVVNEGITG